MNRSRFSLRSGACVLVLSSVAANARAADAHDTSYGRIDGDLGASIAAGATFGPRQPRGAVDLRLRYLWTVGLFATCEDGPMFGGGAEPRRAIAGGLELRPLFLARWFSGLHSGNGYVDMTIDSLGIELGAVFAQPIGAAFGSRPGFQAGLGAEVPLFARATGMFVGFHGGARWSDAALSGRTLEGAADRSLYLTVSLGWQQVFGGHIVDLGDRAPR